MFKLKAPDGSNNLCGKNVKRLRLQQKPPLSQRKLAIKLQLLGNEVDNHVIRRIENGERFVTDIELEMLSKVFDVPYEDLLRPTSTEPDTPEGDSETFDGMPPLSFHKIP